MIFWAALFMCGLVRAEPLSLHYAKALARARSAQAVEALRLSYERFKVASSACQMQIRESQVPSACYEALAIREKFTNSPQEHRQALLKLDALCARASEKFPQNLADTQWLSPACTKLVHAARAIEAYQREAEPNMSGGPDPAWSEI